MQLKLSPAFGPAAMLWALAMSAAITIVWHFPGHMSVDSIVQMYEGFTGDYQSYNPPFMSMLLGWSYTATASQGVFFLGNLSLFLLAMWLWLRAEGWAQIASAVLLLAVAASPVVLTYNGIIWKDVFFANLALLGFALVARVRHLGGAVLALILLTFAAETRQQGLLCVAVVLPLLSVRALKSQQSVVKKLATIAFYLAVIGLTHAGTSALIRSQSKQLGFNGYGAGVMLLQIYDFAGVAATSNVELPKLEQHVSRERLMEYFSGFSPERIDILDQAYKGSNPAIWSISAEERNSAWLEMIRDHPLPYLRHRTEVWSWLLGFHDPHRCVPFHLGISEVPANYVAALGLKAGIMPRDNLYYAMMAPLIDPVFRAWPYVILSLCIAIILSVWNWRKHLVMVAMQVTGLAYVASYFFIGIACDVRYVYFPILSSLVGLAYLLLQMLDAIRLRSISREAG